MSDLMRPPAAAPTGPAERMEALRRSGLLDAHLRPAPGLRPLLDEFASATAREARTPLAMVNLITDQQHFAGLHADPRLAPGGLGRTMTLDEGFCPEVVRRGRALSLPDVCAAPRFSSNPVVDALRIRVYAGAPLIDPATGTPIGTVCVVDVGDPRPREDAAGMLHLINRRRDELAAVLSPYLAGGR
ncbi:GAF domain-containing protein [Streptomyces sp. TRM70308]|uniref:GAF domain-containing protein n=1 Tax=Streptomyces sp. TRM70308 TaxID=3131932 RepID=UPI003CFFBB80